MFAQREIFFGLLAVVVNAAGYYPYIKGVISGTVKPHRITWGIWAILTNIIFINQVLNGGGYSAYFFGSTALLVSTTFVLSLLKGTGGSSRLDIIVLIFSCLLFLMWAFTQNTRVTTIIAVTIDGIAALPTVHKAFKKPETEAYAQWILAACAGVFSALAIPRVDFILLVYPAYVVVMNAVIVVAKYLGTQKNAANK